MTLEEQVTSLKLSTRLKELRVKQDSLFTWVIGFPTRIQLANEATARTNVDSRLYSAFTVAELADMVTPFIDSDGFKGMADKDIPKHLQLDDKNMFATLYSPNYLAELLIYLLENKLINI